MSKREDRQAALLKELKKQGKMSVEQVKNLLGMSDSTVRRMIVELEKDSQLIRSFGGIQAIRPHSKEYSYQETEEQYAEQKRRIGRYAASLVTEGDTIYLSGGSTVKCMAEHLKMRIESEELHKLYVVTNSLVSADVLAAQAEVIVTGGSYRKAFRDLAGSMTEKNLRSVYVSKAFFGAVAISSTEGLMTADLATNSVMELIQERSDDFYVLADSSKFGKNSFISYGSVKDAKAIITDKDGETAITEYMGEERAEIIFV